MKIGIIGCGSMGLKHIRNLLELGHSVVICDIKQERLNEVACEFNIEENYEDYRKIPLTKLDAVVISSDTSTHLNIARYFAKNNIPYFSEIPISDKIGGLQELCDITLSKGVISMVGMIWRFHPAFKIIKKLLSEKRIGQVYSTSMYGGEYLPDWHPGVNYKKEYSAMRSKGGGVIITNISGIDSLRWLLGEVKEIIGLYDNVSNLGIDAEDVFSTILRLKSGVIVTMYSDFFQKPVRNELTIIGEHGSINWDYRRDVVILFNYKKNQNVPYKYDKVDFINIYKDEIKYFIDCITKKEESMTSVFDNINTVKVGLAIKESSEKKEFIDYDSFKWKVQ